MGKIRISRLLTQYAALTGLLACTAVMAAQNASAQEEGAGLRYQAFATADGARFGLLIPGASAVDQIIDSGGPVAQAVLNSLGTSAGFASQPYPGELALIGPGLGATLLGLPQPPSYPFIAVSRHPSVPEARVEPTAFYRLFSKSDETSSSAETKSGHNAPDGSSNGGFSHATAEVTRKGSEVAAASTNRVEGIAAGPLRIGTVLSRAKVTRLAGHDADRSTALEVTGMSIAEQAVGFNESGFVFPGTNTPLPSSDPVLAALAQAQVTVSYLKPEVTPNGVIAPGVRIVAVQTIPGAARTATVSLTLGRAAASVEATGEEISLPAQDTGAARTTEVGSEVPVPAPVEAGVAAPLPVPEVPAVTGISEVSLPVLPGGSVASGETEAPTAPVAAPVSEAAPSPPVRLVQTAGPMAPVGEVSSAAVYPLLAMVGLLVVAGLRFVRGRGVQS